MSSAALQESTNKKSSPLKEEPASKRARFITHHDEHTCSISTLPDTLLDLIISCFTSLEMTSRMATVSKDFRKSTERVAERLVKEESKAHYWSLIPLKCREFSGCVEDRPPWAVSLFTQEHHMMETFHFDTLERAAQFFRRGLGRGTLASFGSIRDRVMFHADFGGLLQFMGGVTPQKCLFARTDTTLEPAGVYRFIAQIYYRNDLRLGGRDYFSVGLVNKDYQQHRNKKLTQEEERVNAASSVFVKLPPLDDSLGRKNVLGIVIDMDSKALEIYSPSAPRKHRSCSFQGINGPLSFGVRQDHDPRRGKMGRDRRFQYGNHEFTIRENTDEDEWNRLFT